MRYIICIFTICIFLSACSLENKDDHVNSHISSVVESESQEEILSQPETTEEKTAEIESFNEEPALIEISETPRLTGTIIEVDEGSWKNFLLDEGKTHDEGGIRELAYGEDFEDDQIFLSLSNNAKLILYGQEADFSKVKVGQRVEVYSDGDIDENFPGTLNDVYLIVVTGYDDLPEVNKEAPDFQYIEGYVNSKDQDKTVFSLSDLDSEKIYFVSCTNQPLVQIEDRHDMTGFDDIQVDQKVMVFYTKAENDQILADTIIVENPKYENGSYRVLEGSLKVMEETGEYICIQVSEDPVLIACDSETITFLNNGYQGMYYNIAAAEGAKARVYYNGRTAEDVSDARYKAVWLVIFP